MLLPALFALSCLMTGNAPAQITDGIADAGLLPGWRTDRGTHIAALRISLRSGWKTYWRTPGEGGIPPQFDWRGSRNVRSAEIHWPTPTLFETNGMRSVVYSGELVLPVEFIPGDPSAPLHPVAKVSIGVCESVCVPVTLRFSGELAPDRAQRDARILAAIGDRPETAAEAGAGHVRCEVQPISDGMRIEASMALPPLGRNEFAVFELPDRAVWIGSSETRRRGGTLIASAEMVPPEARPFSLSRSDVMITVLSDDRAVSIEGCAG